MTREEEIVIKYIQSSNYEEVEGLYEDKKLKQIKINSRNIDVRFLYSDAYESVFIYYKSVLVQEAINPIENSFSVVIVEEIKIKEKLIKEEFYNGTNQRIADSVKAVKKSPTKRYKTK